MKLLATLLLLACIPLFALGQSCGQPGYGYGAGPGYASSCGPSYGHGPGCYSSSIYDTAILFQFLSATAPPPVTLVPGQIQVTAPQVQAVATQAPGAAPTQQPGVPPAAPQLTIEQIRAAVKDEIRASVKAEVAAALKPGDVPADRKNWPIDKSDRIKPPPPTTNVEPAEPVKPMPPADEPPKPAAESLSAVDYKALELVGIQHLISSSCVDCHSAPGRQGARAPLFFDEAGAWTGKVSWKQILTAVSPDPDTGDIARMPKFAGNAGRLSPSGPEIATFTRLASAKKTR